ncbi:MULTISPECIES: hypothetical protein [unclassified Nocardioides]|uniref:hypothetical protein n=1 Tax=unclassified Nocardioides TaxID=2615069 RepID=UPI0009F04874|nr:MULTISPECIES: hypothetical protein [unclassified Nocardioides]GAW49431.1 Putative uncharacterized protein [Nocardioides sp. PD653-B2]GAW55055.1 putative uncharacterized protein [Nocardioides sp. PD653]
MRGPAAALLVLVLSAGVLSGCSSPSSEGGAPTATLPTSPRPTSVVAPTADPETARLQALAQLAEQAAARIPRPRPAAPRPAGAVLGADISWPQCPKGLGIPERRTLGSPLPLPAAEYVVIGLTNGPGFTTNPCLTDQVAWVRERRLLAAAYAVVSYPDAAAVAEHGGVGPYDGRNDLGALANTGYQQALANVGAMRAAGLGSPIIWVDVEPVPDFAWSSDLVANGAVVEGAARAYADAGYRVGIYSTPYLWSETVGDLALGLPEWRAAGQTSRTEALARCGSDWVIQGGRAILGQWVEQGRDQNVTCPGVEAHLGRWFFQY